MFELNVEEAPANPWYTSKLRLSCSPVPYLFTLDSSPVLVDHFRTEADDEQLEW